MFEAEKSGLLSSITLVLGARPKMLVSGLGAKIPWLVEEASKMLRRLVGRSPSCLTVVYFRLPILLKGSTAYEGSVVPGSLRGLRQREGLVQRCLGET